MEMLVSAALSAMSDNFKADSLAWTVLNLFREHVSRRYPGSKHWSPDKITVSQVASHNGSAEVQLDIDIPGASRAYHDIDIFPVNGNWLTIPLDQSAQGHSARDFDLFRPYKRGTKTKERADVLLQKDTLVAMYALSQHVHQSQDRTLLPDDQDIITAVLRDYAKQMNDMDVVKVTGI